MLRHTIPCPAPITHRITVERPVPGALHSLQSKDNLDLDPKRSVAGEPLSFDVSVRVAPEPQFFGDQVRREGPTRRFVYVRGLGERFRQWIRIR